MTLSLSDDLTPILAVDGRTAADVMSGATGRFLAIHAGRIRFTEPRVKSAVLATATASEVASTHARLADALAAQGDRGGAAWHRARACPVADRAAAVTLTVLARDAAKAGMPERCLLFAAEAAAHATGDIAEEARLLAGCAALACGFAAEAAAWLGGLFPQGAPHRRVRALGPLLAAHTVVHGVVPPVDPQRCEPAPSDPSSWADWARSAALAAILCAERGDRKRSRRWLAAVREAALRAGNAGPLRDAVADLCRLLSGEDDPDGAAEVLPLLGRVSEALHAGTAGRIDEGLRTLRGEGPAGLREDDPLLPGFERSPVVRAYEAVTEVLLLVWRGDIGRARKLLLQAAVEVPIGVPFAGLGIVLVRRLDLAVLGALGPFARALTAGLPPAAELDLLVDRAVEAFLDGSFEAAAGAIGLWRDRGAPQPSFAVPGLDDVAPVLPASGLTVPCVRPADADFALALRTAVARAAEGRWNTDQEVLREGARRLRSPFARGRVEALLGVQSAVHDDIARARVHFQHAERLFEAAGAAAWARAVRRRLDRLEASGARRAAAASHLRACRSSWSQRLTSRELEIAMLAVDGRGNRDIALMLSVSVRTVEVHLGRVFAKLQVRNRVELTVLAHRTERHL